jgi:hypothetical protein
MNETKVTMTNRDKRSFHIHGADAETIRVIRMVAADRGCTIAAVVERSVSDTIGTPEEWAASMGEFARRRAEVLSAREGQ